MVEMEKSIERGNLGVSEVDEIHLIRQEATRMGCLHLHNIVLS